MIEPLPPSAADVSRWQAEEAERRRKEQEKKKKKGWKLEESGEVLNYTVVGGAGQADSTKGFPKGRVNVGTVPTVPR